MTTGLKNMISVSEEVQEYDENVKSIYPPKYCENTIIRYRMNQEVLFGKIIGDKQFRYDLMEVLMINLPTKIPDEKAEQNLTGMLKTLLTPELPAKTIIERLECIYHIPMTEWEKGDFGEMCNLGEAILERGIERGIQQGIQAYLELCCEMGIAREEAKLKMQEKFELTEKDAEKYIKQYYH